jgi:hypothetical protein
VLCTLPVQVTASARENKMPRKPMAPAWCDKRWRCTLCPGGMGNNGRGFARFRNVPCRDPDEHIRKLQPSQGEYIHVARHQYSQVRCLVIPDGTQERCIQPFQITPECFASIRTPGQWCMPCRNELGISADIIPLNNRHVQQLSNDSDAPRAKRRRKAALIWCDNKFRCVHCFPAGQTRRLGARCVDPEKHMPSGVTGEAVVHLADAKYGLFCVPNEAKTTIRDCILAGDCEQCKAMLRKCNMQIELKGNFVPAASTVLS